MNPIETVGLNEDALAELRRSVSGDVFSPTDTGYDAGRAAWNLVVDQHPALVLMAAKAGDIAEGVRFARANRLDVMLQATGHGVIRPADGALLINTAHMAGVAIDPNARTAWMEAGTKWGAVLEAAHASGLAPLLGSSPEIGAVAYTLGGGAGWLVRKYGLSADSVRRFEVVTADGEQRTASAAENPDLFWGLRGGGGSLAAVTGMEVRLYPVETVYGGVMVYPPALAAAVLGHWREWIKTVPDEMTSAVKIINMPNLEDVPPPMRGQTFVMVEGCYCGTLTEGEALIDTWRKWQAPLMDSFQPMPFSMVAQISQDPADPMPSFSTNVWLKDLDEATIDTLIRYATLQEGQVPLIFAEVRHIGGAARNGGVDAGAFGYRDAELLLVLIGMVPAPPLWQALADYTGRLKAAVAPALTGTVYMNFLEGAESVARVRDGFPPETFARLAALKAKYDPENVFNRALALPVGM